MSNTTHPPELVGTWQCVESFKKSGEVVPYPDGVPKLTYSLNADGSGVTMPGTIAEWPMRWSVEGGRLSLGATAPKSKSTHTYELTDTDTLVLHDRHGGRSVFKRQSAGG
jgi:hypothetical protein